MGRRAEISAEAVHEAKQSLSEKPSPVQRIFKVGGA